MKATKATKIMLMLLLLSVQILVHSFSDFSSQLLDKINEISDSEVKQRAHRWMRMLDENKTKSDALKLYEVNKFFNQLAFRNDLELWEQQDYWATPLEFIQKNAGDCEDFTIAKYFSLLELGIPNHKLRLMYVTVTKPNQAHMVLAYYENNTSIPLVLDNLNPKILAANQRRDLIPVYSFNGDGLWLAKSQGQGRKLQSKGPNKLWDDLQARFLEDIK